MTSNLHRLAILLVLTAPLIPGGAVAQAGPPTPTPPPAAPAPGAPANNPAAQAPAQAPAQATPAATPAVKPALPPERVPDSLFGRTMVSFVSGPSIYIGAGSLDGVFDGSRIAVVKQGVIVAELKVRFLSSHSAACDLITNTTVNVYDSVRYSGIRKDTSKAALAKATPPPRVNTGVPRTALQQAGIRGRFGLSLQLLTARDVAAPGTITQPSIDAHVDGFNVGGSPFSFSLDARSRRTSSTFVSAGASSQSYTLTRVYQAMIAWVDPKAGVRVAAGRQYSATISPLSLFDGVNAEIFKRQWSYGIFAGTQPDPLTMAWSANLKEYGGYVQVHRANVPAGTVDDGRRWAFTLGAIDSYYQGAINREFLFLQALYSDRRFNLYATQEVDYNRGWKVDSLHQSAIQPTSTFINANLNLSDALSFFGGYDNRRNVLLYRDLSSITPETQFDDSYRQGMWGGIYVTPTRVLRLSFDARINNGGLNGSADSYSAGLNTSGLFPLSGMLRARATRYLSASTDGWLFAGAFGLMPAGRLHMEFNGGVRQEHSPAIQTGGGTAPQTYIRWFGADFDVPISAAWFVLLSMTRTTGTGQNNDQAFMNLSYRF